MRLVILFDTGYELVVNLRNNDFVRRWVQLLEEELLRTEILQDDSYSFLYTEQQSRDKLIDAINVVNSFTKREFISLPSEEDFEDSDFYNDLHRKFEQLCGPDYSIPTRIMTVGPRKLKDAIRHLNRFCHRLERRPYSLDAPMQVEFFCPNRRELLVEDYDLFEEYEGKNIVHLDYSTLGKTLYECFNDGLPSNYPGMKIQNHYNPNFIIAFRKNIIAKKDEFLSWLRKNQIENIPKQEIGVIILGEFDDDEAENKIRETRKITGIRIERDKHG